MNRDKSLRIHYHIWLIGALCALTVLAIGNVLSHVDLPGFGISEAPAAAPLVNQQQVLSNDPQLFTTMGAQIEAGAEAQQTAPSNVPDANHSLRTFRGPAQAGDAPTSPAATQ